MKIYILRDGKQTGPYSLANIQRMVAAQTLKIDDLAWYQGQAEWIQLKEVPGFFDRPAPSRPRLTQEFPVSSIRPNLVWFFCILSFIGQPINLLRKFGLLYLMIEATPALSIPPELTFPEDLFYADPSPFLMTLLAISIFSTLVELAATVLLFLLRKTALYVYLASFALHVLVAGVIWLQTEQGGIWVIIYVVYYGVILYYFGGPLKKKGLMR